MLLCHSAALFQCWMPDLLTVQAYQAPSPKKSFDPKHQFVAAMSDSGLKGTTVYHNATPSELYEKASNSVLLYMHFMIITAHINQSEVAHTNTGIQSKLLAAHSGQPLLATVCRTLGHL